jgi:hypothetical protein
MNAEQTELIKELEEKLFSTHGPMMTGDMLYKSLGYSSADAFRQAISRKTVPINTFLINKRRGRFALTTDIATWVAKQRLDNIE